jgi:hypothetical protein
MGPKRKSKEGGTELSQSTLTGSGGSANVFKIKKQVEGARGKTAEDLLEAATDHGDDTTAGSAVDGLETKLLKKDGDKSVKDAKKGEEEEEEDEGTAGVPNETPTKGDGAPEDEEMEEDEAEEEQEAIEQEVVEEVAGADG